MEARLLNLEVHREQDIVVVRQRARELSKLLGLGAQDQTRIGTTLTELVRSSLAFATDIEIEFVVGSGQYGDALTIRVRNTIDDSACHESGGAPDTADVRDGLNVARRLMDGCDVEEAGNRIESITLRKDFSHEVILDKSLVDRVISQLASTPNTDTFAELSFQNRELLEALAEVRTRNDELKALTHELEETNRGVVALYVELEEKADALRAADAMKSRFLSNTSHELRTPLSSIRALAKLLLDRLDGDLTEEQDKQVRLIEKAANELSTLVNDLLDLARIEAGKVQVMPSSFTVDELFGALRGVLRPLAINDAVSLTFELVDPKQSLHTDEGKVTQILRNFIDNALKFTEHGEVRVRAEIPPEEDVVRFTVSDTGIGMREADLAVIFEEFSQIENSLQEHVKGTGLGLSLCRKLATLLGGHVEATSEPGQGSTFFLTLPRHYGTGSDAGPSAFQGDEWSSVKRS